MPSVGGGGLVPEVLLGAGAPDLGEHECPRREGDDDCDDLLHAVIIACPGAGEWAQLDLNQRPRRYQRRALTN